MAPSQLLVRHGNGSGTDGLTFLLSDHLGSASKTVDPLSNTVTNKPNVLTENRYKAWANNKRRYSLKKSRLGGISRSESRHTSGAISTDYTFTGQMSEMQELGLDFYMAWW